MKFRFVIPVLAAVMAPALAQDMAPDMPRHHAAMCTNLYAHAVGKLATLEVQLKLTAAQKAPFDRWKSVKLASAKSHSAKCEGMKMPGRDLSIVDGLKLETAMLEARLADLKAEAGPLEDLVAVLDKDQQETLGRAARHAMHERMGFAEHVMARHGRGRHHMGGDVPPPPPEH
jgi:hypothetical protein